MWHLHRASLDDTTMGKQAHLAVPRGFRSQMPQERGNLRVAASPGLPDPLQKGISIFPEAVQNKIVDFVETQTARQQLLDELKRQPSSRAGDVAAIVPEVDLATKTYPKINLNMPGLRVLNEEPPVYMVDNFLEASECDALIRAAKSDELEPIKFSGKYALLDHSRLWPIFPMLFLSAVPSSHALERPIPSLEGLELYLQVLGPNALLVGTMLLIVPRLIETLVASGSQFSGLKWTGLDALDEKDPARLAHESILQNAEKLCFARRTQFERPTVTRYQKGGRQDVHSDAYHPPEPGKEEEYLAGGGQRLAQCLVYLNDVPKEDGGSTKFFHPSVNELAVQPKKGSALVFFPAFADGTEDTRMMHSGEEYTGEGSKWLAGTWLHESDVPLTPHRLSSQPIGS
eukprot:gnl/TRDRNA2_/TRDRNA2_192911_c0_seq1.p1 gnl/TRDRNA2_/TRDRNA2_192911_c0~~gnl/TRDRNA2_/TRDRNA2_192911_c0_seq1.p1  ORF type:complete len:449 (+),score=65.06 gnl/TRDRNA2_/TRDRNA2_192911_c0_seq1:147-1349(+)